MSVKVMTWVWEHSPAAGNDRLILLAIADCANDQGRDAWPSLGTLAHKTRLHRRTVERRIESMESSGWLAVDRGAGPGGTHRYRVVMDDGGTPVGGRQPARGGNPPDAAQPAAGDTTPAAVGGAAPGAARTSLNVPEPPRPARKHAAEAAAAVLDELTRTWRLTQRQAGRLAPRVADALSAGWDHRDLVARLTANTATARDPFAVLSSRLSDLDAAPTDRARVMSPRPTWCGACDESTRLVETAGGAVARCGICHPLRANDQACAEREPDRANHEL